MKLRLPIPYRGLGLGTLVGAVCVRSSLVTGFAMIARAFRLKYLLSLTPSIGTHSCVLSRGLLMLSLRCGPLAASRTEWMWPGRTVDVCGMRSDPRKIRLLCRNMYERVPVVDEKPTTESTARQRRLEALK